MLVYISDHISHRGQAAVGKFRWYSHASWAGIQYHNMIKIYNVTNYSVIEWRNYHIGRKSTSSALIWMAQCLDSPQTLGRLHDGNI